MGPSLTQIPRTVADIVPAYAWSIRFWSPRRQLLATLAAIVFLLISLRPLCATDPYAAALDKKFESGTAQQQAIDPKVAALEEGLKAQVREMSQRPEVAAAPEPSESSPWLVLGGIIMGAAALGLIGLFVLRRWNHWLDKQRAKRQAAIADDPLMVEFLRALHEELPLGPPGTQTLKLPPSSAAPTPDIPQPSPAINPPRESRSLALEKVAALRAEFQRIGRATEQAQKLNILAEVLHQTASLKESATPNHLRSVRLLASGLHGLLNQLALKPSNITPSVLRTAAGAIDLLELLCSRESRPDLSTAPPVRLLTVDDDPISLRAVTVALKKAFSEPDQAADGPNGLALATHHRYDLIFLDIEMPGMDGFELCSKIHETDLNRKTPVVFVTSHTDFDSRTKSAWLGAQDLIGKPFLAFEITVKALTLVLRAREEAESSQGAEQALPGVECESKPEALCQSPVPQVSFDPAAVKEQAPLNA